MLHLFSRSSAPALAKLRDMPGGEVRAKEMANELREKYKRRRNLMAELDWAGF